MRLYDGLIVIGIIYISGMCLADNPDQLIATLPVPVSIAALRGM